MERVPTDIGHAYRIDLGGTDFARKPKELARDLETLPGCHLSARGLHLELWHPDNPKGSIMPNMIIDVGEFDILISDLGGHDGRLMEELGRVVDQWNLRLGGKKLAVERYEP